ncbi:outer membrane beta-barrel protein [Sphingobacterium sp.]|uniref:outer membrane beta-barrel protein n=1 Tax=Sphingobacterium sp. TaxID=341027 RepID=UPI0028AE57AA|nr:outer membrane beta-barrel protein [Sphingobacterium sp.]
MKKKTRLLLIFSFAFFAIGKLSAQFSRPVSIGIGAGGTYALTDLSNSGTNFSLYGELDYLINPFISIGLRGEKGKLKGSGYDSEFKNSIYAGNLNAKVRIGQFMKLNSNYSYYTLGASVLSKIVSNIYLGAGAGVIKNGISRQVTPSYAERIIDNGGEFAKDRSGFLFAVPLNIGFDMPFGRTLYGPQWALNINYQHTLTNDNLDGIIFRRKDQYGFLSVGAKYAIFKRK